MSKDLISKDFIDTIKKVIHGGYHLDKDKNNNWILEESCQKIKINTPNEHSMAFSLDKKNHKPFAFFSDTPPADFTKICDAILFCFHGNKTYLFLIEVKTGNEGDYEKQLINGKLFCDWLTTLYAHHKSTNPELIVVPLLIWKPRHSIRKGTTTHRSSSDGIKEKKIHQLNGFEVIHCDTLLIIHLISRLSQALKTSKRRHRDSPPADMIKDRKLTPRQKSA